MKVCIWTIYPNHYQAAFHDALREAGVDLRVCYFGTYCQNRIQMGWVQPSFLPLGEYYATTVCQGRAMIPDFDERIQINTGFYNSIYWNVIRYTRKHNMEWIHWSESSSQRWRSFFLRKVYGYRVRRYALGAFAIGNMAARDFQRWGVPQSKIVYLPYTTPLPSAIKDADRDRDISRRSQITFVFCGTLCKRKAVDLVLLAFDDVWHSNPNSRLVLIGNDALDSHTKRLLTKLDSKVALRYLGVVPPQSIDFELAKCDVCLLPSRFDGWGLALAEGARNGLALIGSDRCGSSDHLISHGRSGFIVKAGNLASLTDAMRKYVLCPELARRHGVEAKRLVGDTAGTINAQRFIQATEKWRSPQ